MARAVRGMLSLVVAASLLPASPVIAQPAAEDALPPRVAEPSPLVSDPKTSDEIFAAVVLLVELGRFDLAQQYLNKFEQSNFSDTELLALRDQYGTGEFLRLSRIKDLQPAGKSLLARLNKISQTQAEDAGYVDGLITRLNGTNIQRDIAISELRNAGPRAVPQMLKQVQAVSGPERDRIVFALTRMGQPVIPVLIGGLQSTSDPVRQASISALRSLQSRESVPYLWLLSLDENTDLGTRIAGLQAIAYIRYGSTDRTDKLSDVIAIEDLRKRATALLKGETTLKPEDGNDVTLWNWNHTTQTVEPLTVKAAQADLLTAAKFAHDAFLLGTDRPDSQTLYLTALLASEVGRLGWDEPLSPANSRVLGTAIASGTSTLRGVLHQSLEWNRIDAAWGALQALGQSASPELLERYKGDVSPVVRALNYPDPRIQFGAAVVVVRSNPRRQFLGSERVVEIFRRALTDLGQARAVIINPDRNEAATIADYLTQQGLQPFVTQTGRSGFEHAASTSGVNLLVVHANVARWPLSQTITNLRADARTASVPIIIYGPEDVRGETAVLVSRTSRCRFVAEAPAADAFWEQAQPLLAGIETPPISALQRAEFRSLATFWLAKIATTKLSAIFDVTSSEPELLSVASEPELTDNALAALNRLPSIRVQTQFAEWATIARYPLPLRVRSAQELAEHIGLYGLLLPDDSVRAVTTAWESETDPALKSALTSVVATFKPSTALVSERLKKIAPVTAVPAP